MIWRNFIRDLRHTASRLISVMIITMLAVAVYTGLSGIPYNVDLICDGYFDAQNLADYWITGIYLDQADCRKLAQLSGVTGVQPRVVADGEKRGDSSITLELYGVSANPTINMPLLSAGTMPSSSREVLLSELFAQAQGISVGEWYELTLTATGENLRLLVCGLVKNPECLYHINATTPSPDYSRYGFAYCGEEVLERLMGPNRYNQVCITVAEGTDAPQLRAAIEEALGEKVVNILARKDNARASFITETKNNIEPILDVFPILFFLCAVLMMVSTMNRLIESARMDVGTFKALGYSDGTIMFYYLLHALLVVAAGFPAGAFAGRYIAALVVNTLAIGCDLPAYEVVHDVSSWREALVITTVCCVGSAWLVARSLLKENPAQCMRPKPPKAAKTLLLERVGILWRRLGFNQKYIIRNTLRNKVRMFTCVVGIAFCMALVLLAFALKDSIDHYAAALSERQNQYDILVDLSSGVTEAQYRRAARAGPDRRAELEQTAACWLYSEDALCTAAVTVAEDTVSLHLYDPYGPTTQTLPADGMVLEKALAEQLGVTAGDTLSVRFTGDPRFYTVRVARVDRCVSGAYMGRSFWRSLGQTYAPTTVYLAGADPAALAAELEDYGFVSGWQTRETVIRAILERMQSMTMVVYVLILFGGGLACIVIYNLGIMSFFEQIRGLATLMVLGFYEKEIKRLQLSENIIFAAAGIALGIPLGLVLNKAIITSITTMPLETATRPFSLILSGAITMVFALAVNVLIGWKMRDIDMLGALKSVE